MARDALVVGINQYPFLKDTPSGKVRHLRTPASDAEAIAQLLEADNNFRVQRLPASNIDGKLQVDPKKLVTVDELSKEIQKLFSRKDEQQAGLLFFAGHALPQLNSLGTKKNTLLLTSDAKPTEWKGILLGDLWELLGESSVIEQIIWLDCCYSGELLELKDSDLLGRISGRKRFLIAASHSSEVAYERLDGRHGVLSGALIAGLNPYRMTQNEWITDRKLADFVEEELKAYYREAKIPQAPQIRRPDGEIKLILGKGLSTVNKQIEPKESTTRKIPFVLPQLDVSTFTGRDEELRKLEELLLNRQGTKVCSIAGLAGVGGIGKSALACHFATIHKDDFPDGVIGLRVGGKDVDTIAREFARRYGEEIDLEDERDAATIMQEVFAHRQMLLIFDNADDASIRALRPGGDKCAVIVTTRDRGLPISLDIPDSGRINLPTLSDPDSLSLMQKLLGEDRVVAEPEAASQLIDLSGQLPLALQIIGAALKLHKERSLSEYATSLSEERRLARLRVRGDEHLDVRSSFSLSLKLLQPEEINFFACLSVCAEDGFSLRTAIVTNDCDDCTAQDYLDYLYKLSLLNYSEVGKNRFVFHPLIRLFAQDLAVERNLRDEAQARHAKFFIDFVKSCPANDPSIVPLLAQELKDIVLAGEWLQRKKIADYKFAICLLPFFQKCGYWQQAVDFMSGFQTLAEHNEHWNVIVLLCIQKSKYLSLLGAWYQAEESLNQIAGIPDKIHEYDTRQRCRAMWLNALGGVLQRQGRLDEAVRILQNCVLIAEDLNDKRYLAISLNVLRVVLQQQGRLENAVALLQISIENAEKLNSKNSLLVSLWVLGEVLKEQGRFDQAISIFYRSIEITKQLGDKEQLLIRLDILVELLQQQDRFDEILEILQLSVQIAEQIDDQKKLLIRLNVLAKFLKVKNRIDEAIKVIQYSVEVAEKFDNTKIIIEHLCFLADALGKKGDINEALRIVQHSVELAEQLGNKKILLNCLNILSRLLQQNYEFNKAIKVIQYTLEIEKQLNNWAKVTILSSFLGNALKRQGRLDDALAVLQSNVEACEQLNSKKLLVSSLNNLGEFLQRQGRFDEAVSCIQRSVEIADKHNIKKLLPSSLHNLWEALLLQGKLNEAKNIFQRILKTADENSNKELIVARLNTVGKILQKQERWDEAVIILKQNVEFAQQLDNQLSLITTLNNLGWVLRQQQKWDEAEKIFRRSQNICEDLNEAGNLLVIALHSLGIIYEKRQKGDEAEKTLRYSYDLCVKLEDQRGQAMILNSLGLLIQKQEGEDKFQLALMYFRASIKLGEQLNDQKHLAKAHTAMGKALLDQGDINKATEELCKGFEIDESLTNCSGLGKVTPQLTYALIKLGRREEAVSYCQRALAISPNDQNLQKLYNKLSSAQQFVNTNTLKQGSVKHIRYNRQQGYYWGHITPNDGSADIYFREGFIDSYCISKLKKGTLVEVEVKQTPKWLCAINIRIIDGFGSFSS